MKNIKFENRPVTVSVNSKASADLRKAAALNVYSVVFNYAFDVRIHPPPLMKNVRTIAASTTAHLHYSKNLKSRITTWIESRAATALFFFRTNRLKVSIFLKL